MGTAGITVGQTILELVHRAKKKRHA